MNRNAHIHARVVSNVRVVVLSNNQIVQEKRFKNTTTRLLTQSICDFLSGADVSYLRGVGRPNFVGLGTMGIKEQGDMAKSTFEPQFSNTNPPAEDRTRPWYESTSLALTDVTGTVTKDKDGKNPHFWNPRYGWGTPDNPDVPCFEGELCTAPDPAEKDLWIANGWEPINRLPILRADIVSEPPEDKDFGIDGYSTSAVFYSYASPQWINKLLEPQQFAKEPTYPDEMEPVGPQLQRIAISEFGLYERNNSEPGGLTTMLAGFRVPNENDVIYLEKNQVLILEWRVSVRALMPYEGVEISTGPEPEGISVFGNIIDEEHLQLNSVVRGDDGVSQKVNWSVSNNQSSDTTIDETGLLTLGPGESSDMLYVDSVSAVKPEISTRSVVFLGSDLNQVYKVELTVGELTNMTIQHTATVTGRGTFSPDVVWRLIGNDSSNTTLSDTGLLTISADEGAEYLEVIATSVADERISSSNVVMLGPTVVRMDTNPILELSNLTKSIGHAAIASSLGTAVCTLTFTVHLIGHSVGTARIILEYSTATSSTAQNIEIPVTGATDRVYTTTIPLSITEERTRIVVTASGPITISDTSGYIIGSHYHEVEYFDVTTADDYLMSEGVPVYYTGDISMPLIYPSTDHTVACTLMDGNPGVFEAGIPEGITSID